MSDGRARRHLAGGAVLSIGAQAAPIVSGAVLSIVLARLIGPSGNGTYSLLATLIGAIVLIFSLGLGTGLTYEVSSGRWSGRRALVASYRMAVPLGALGAAAGLGFYALTRHTVLGGIHAALVFMAIASVPAFLAYQYASGIALGQDRYEAYALLEVTHAAIILLVAAVLTAPFGLTGAIVGLAASGVVTALVGWLVLRRGGGERRAVDPEPDAVVLRRATRFGVLAWFSNVLQQANYRFDLLILGGYAATRDVGVYSVAVTVTAIAWVLPQALQMVVFPRTADLAAAAAAGELEASESDEHVARSIRHAVLLTVPAALGTAFLLAVMVPLLYGSRFADTVPLGFILLPGVLAIGVGKVMTSVITGRGRPVYNVYMGLISVPVTLGLYFALIPSHHAWGASIASTISYFVTAAVALVFFRRVTGLPMRSVLPRRSDVRDYAQALEALRGHLRERRSGAVVEPAGPVSVLILPAWYPTHGQPGSGVYVRDQALAVAAAGDHVAVVSDEDPLALRRRLFRLTDSIEEGVRTFRLVHRRTRVGPLAAAGYLLGILTAMRRLRREGRPVDVIHAHVHRAGWAAVLVGGLTRTPVVITEHSTEFLAGTLTRGARRRARIAFRRAALVCPVGEELRRAIEAEGIAARFRVVPNPVDTELFHPPTARPDGPPRFLVVAGLHPRKGVAEVLRAFARLDVGGDGARLDVAGDGPDRAAYERLAAELGIAGAVRFLGHQPKERIAELMRTAHVLVVPSLAETFGITAVEGLASGLPVVGTRAGELPAIVGDAGGTIVSPGDVVALRDALQWMAEHHGNFDSLVLAASVRERYGLEALGREWASIYREVMHGRLAA